MQTIQREEKYWVTTRQFGDTGENNTVDLLKDVFVCVSIPIIVYGFAYVTLLAVLRLFLS